MRDELIAALAAARVPAASVAVWANGHVHAAASGLLNVRTGVEATPDAVFQVGSITKLLTATLILQLRDAGMLELDDPVARHLPHLRPTALGPIRLRALLTHTGGLASDYVADTGEGSDCVSRYVELLAKQPVLFAPELCASYSNPGFILLGAVCEGITGQSWDDLILARILRPAGMDSSFTRPIELARYRSAIGHYTVAGTGAQVVVPTVALNRSAGPGGASLWSTATDLLRFAQALATGTPAILAPDSVTEMLTPHVALPAGDGSFGYSWSIAVRSAQTFASHGGATIGQNSILLMVPQRRFAISVLTNSGDGIAQLNAFYRSTVARFLGEPPARPVAREPSASVALDPGRYIGEFGWGDVRLRVDKVGERLVVNFENLSRPDTPVQNGQGVLIPIGGDEFVSAAADTGVPGAAVKFLTLKRGAPRPDVLYSFGRAYPRLDSRRSGSDTGAGA